MVITVNIPNNAIASMDEKEIITISLQVYIMNDTVVIGDKVITISVFRYTSNVLTHAVSMMIDAINQYKVLCVKNMQIQTALVTFTSLVKVGV